MNILKLNLSVLVVFFLLTACGGSKSSSSGSKSTSSFTEAKTVEQAEKNLYALGYILSAGNILDTNSIYSMRNINSPRKLSDTKLTVEKERTIECDKGTVNSIESDVGTTLIYKECTTLNGEYYDGTVSIKVGGIYDYMFEYSNYTTKKSGVESYRDHLIKTVKTSDETGVATTSSSLNGVYKTTDGNGVKNNVTYSNYILTSTYETTTYNGKFELEFKCITGTYIVETVEKLVYSTQYKITDSIISGILKLNGATYTYEYPYVTIEAGGESKTYFQSLITKRMNGYRKSDCSI